MTLLGLRLALSADRVRLAVTAVAVSFTVAFLLGALGALPARQAKLDRLDARAAVSVGSPAGRAHQPSGLVYVTDAAGHYRGRPLGVRLVTAGPGAPLPPGLRAYPRAGEVVASPELAAVLRGPRGSELSSRVPGRLVGTVGAAGLAGPHELYAYVGRATPSRYERPVAYFGFHTPKRPAPLELRVAAWLGALGLLLPVLVLVATATRLSAASRDRRLSALRLVGATPRQARVLGATDGLVAGVLGVLGGLVVFLLLRGPACALLPFPEGVYAQDLDPGLPGLLAVVGGVPVLAVASGVLSLRRVVTSPLGVRRSARTRGAQWWRLLPVGTGLAMLVALRLLVGTVSPGTALGNTLLLGGNGLVLVGLAVAASTFARAGGWLLGRLPSTSAALAARRVQADPGGSARVVTGMVLVVFVAAWLLAFLPVLQADRAQGLDFVKAVPAGTMTTASDLGSDPVDVGALRAIPGVRQVFALGSATVTVHGDPNPDDQRQVSVVPCHDLAQYLGTSLRCGPAKVVTVPVADGEPLPPGVPLDVLGRDGGGVVGRLTVPRDAPALPVLPALYQSGLLGGAIAVDPSLLPRAAYSSRYVITTSGDPTTVEAVRNALPTELALTADTVREQASSAGAVYLGYLRAVRIGIVLALVVGAASLAVTTSDAVSERRRSLAALVAIGTPARVLRRTVLLQMAAPMLTNVLAALVAAAVASSCYLGLYDSTSTARSALPWGGWSLTALAAVLVVVLATATTLPLLRAVSRPEALRAE